MITTDYVGALNLAYEQADFHNVIMSIYRRATLTLTDIDDETDVDIEYEYCVTDDVIASDWELITAISPRHCITQWTYV